VKRKSERRGGGQTGKAQSSGQWARSPLWKPPSKKTFLAKQQNGLLEGGEGELRGPKRILTLTDKRKIAPKEGKT